MLKLASMIAITSVVLACTASERSVSAETDAREKACAFENPRLVGPDSALEGWYARQINAMLEPRLGAFVDSSDSDVIRFLWLRSFHSAIAVRAIRRGASYSLVSAKLAKPTGLCPATLVRIDSVRLSERRWKTLLQALRDPTFEPAPLPENVVTADGASWVVESVIDGHYRVVDVPTPERNGRGSKVRRFGLELVRFAGLMPSPWEIY